MRGRRALPCSSGVDQIYPSFPMMYGHHVGSWEYLSSSRPWVIKWELQSLTETERKERKSQGLRPILLLV